MVYRRARTILGNDADARDVTQDVFIKVMRVQSGLDQEVSAWLYQVTTRACLNRLRARRRYYAMQERTAREEVESSYNADTQWLVRWLLAEGDPACTSAALYVYVEGMSHEEAAEILGVSRRTVGNMLERFSAWARCRLTELHAETSVQSRIVESQS
jgi:RNA polymerase sigma-70 factor (ECF subfamily)